MAGIRRGELVHCFMLGVAATQNESDNSMHTHVIGNVSGTVENLELKMTVNWVQPESTQNIFFIGRMVSNVKSCVSHFK